MLSLPLFLACAASIAPDGNDSGSAGSLASGDAVIDATSETDWVYLDLSEAALVTPDNPDDSTTWDLGLRRYKVKINGGISGTADMAVVPYFETDYNTALAEPTDGWVTDQPDADGDGDPEYALDTWFDYDSDTHQVTPADVIYVVRDATGELVKLQFLDYYDDAGTPGFVHIRWGALADEQEDPTGDGGADDERTCSSDTSLVSTTDLGDGLFQTRAYTATEGVEVCFSFSDAAGEGSGSVTQDWDLSWFKWDIQGGDTEIAILPKQDFASLIQAPADGYLTDTEKELVLVDWYVYDPELHILLPADEVYVLHTADDRYWKMQILSYYPEDDTEYKSPHWPLWQWAEIAAPE